MPVSTNFYAVLVRLLIQIHYIIWINKYYLFHCMGRDRTGTDTRKFWDTVGPPLMLLEEDFLSAIHYKNGTDFPEK